MNSSLPPLYDSQQPWNGLPELPPSTEIESKEILKACISARAELARVDALVETLPNKDILIQAIPLQEARSSSEIENIVTTSDALYRALASNGSEVDANAKEVLRYREALWQGMDKLAQGQALTMPLFENICSRIRGVDVRVRNEQVMIGNPTTGNITYTPPNGEQHLTRLLTNLEHFLMDDQDGVDPLVKMAVMHYQFEAIHPFLDGNGRTGRILNILYLLHRRLLSSPILYLSRFFIAHRDNYYRFLLEVTEQNDWQQWILYILKAVESTSRDTVTTIEAMRALMDDIFHTAKAGKTKAAERQGFIELLFKWPYCKINIVERNLECSRVTATRYLNEMVNLGLLERIKRGREYYYVNTRLINLLAE